MNQKQIGVLLIILGLIVCFFVTINKQKDDRYIGWIIEQQNGSCYVEGGTVCLHEDRDYTPYIVGYIAGVSLIILGIYLFWFDKTGDLVLKQSKEVSEALKQAKSIEKDKDEFAAFIAGFSREEQIALKAIKEQEGITQSTLRFRTGFSKASLSLLLKELENKGIISKKQKGKTNEIYLIKKY